MVVHVISEEYGRSRADVAMRPTTAVGRSMGSQRLVLAFDADPLCLEVDLTSSHSRYFEVHDLTQSLNSAFSKKMTVSGR